MKKTKQVLAMILAAAMLSGLYAPVGAYAEEKADYSVSADYAARYPNGVIEFLEAEASLDEGGEQELKLIRKGGTSGKVSIEVKAIDITAKFGEDYTVSAGNEKLEQDEEYSGTLTENYLEEAGEDYITSEEILNDEEYKEIIGYTEPEKLTDEETAALYGASVDMVSETLGISTQKAEQLVNAQESAQPVESAEPSGEAAEEKQYTSSLHEFKDSVLGEKTAANQMDAAGLLDEDTLLGSNDANLAAAAVNDAAVGASVIVTFAEGENEKTITIKAKDDDIYEPQEAFSLGLCNPEGGAEIGELFNAGVRINDNDEVELCQIGFDTDYIQVSADEQAAKVEIVRTGGLNDYAQISVRTVEDTATEGIDYLPVNGSSLFMPGEEKKTVIVPLKTANAVLEESKTLDLVLECDAYSAEMAISRATVEIVPAQAENSVSLFAAQQEEDLPPIELSPAALKKPYVSDIYILKDYDLHTIESIEVDVTRLSGAKRNPNYFDVCKPFTYLSYYGYNYSSSGTDSKSSDTIKLYDGESATLRIDGLNKESIEYYRKYFYNQLSIVAFGDKDRFDHNAVSLHMDKEIQVNAVRLYPRKLYTRLRTDPWIESNWVDGKWVPAHWTTAGKVSSQYRVFDSAENVIQTVDYDAGTITIPDFVYRGYPMEAKSYSLSSEAKKRGVDFWGYDLAIGYSEKSTTGTQNGKRRGTEFDLEDYKALFSSYNLNDDIRMYPLFMGDYINSIHVDEYKQNMGVLKIGGTAYNSQDVTSKSWREGDELKMIVEPARGYKCDNILIIRANGTTEKVTPGENTMLSKGMRVYPEFEAQDITVTLNWASLGTGTKEEMEENLKDYTLASDHDFIDNKNGSYTFKNMIPGDIVTLYAAPKNPDGEKNHTGLWGRTKLTDSEKSMNDDMRFVLCVGDAFAFEVDDHDMAFSYYFNPKDEYSGGTLVKGQVVTTGGTIKNPNNVKLNAGNVDFASKPVANASVSVLSTDPNAVYTKNGTTYYTNAMTDGSGYFTVYLPGGSQNLGYSIAIADSNRVFQKVAVYDKGITVYELPFQNSNFQIDRMTLGTNMETTEIPVGDTNIILGIHAVIANGYRAQQLKMRSYDAEGMLLREWMAVESSSPDWTYETKFVPSEYLKEGGRLTVELYDANGKGQGEVDTGYSMKTRPVTASFTLPQFDPKESVTLPILGDVTSKFDLGSDSSTKPKDGDEKSEDKLSSGKKSSKNMMEVTYGSGKAVKNAVKAAKSDPGYAEKDAQGKAYSILGNVSVDSKDSNTVMEKKAETRGGKGKNAMDFGYELGVYMSMYTQEGKYYYEDMTLYASISASAGTTQQFMIAGIPLYLTLGGEASGSMLLRLDTDDGEPLEIINPKAKGYFNKDMLDSLQTTGVFNILIKVKIGAGFGNPKIVSAGIGGTLDMNMDYQPWEDGGGIASFGLNAEFNLIGISIKYNITKASYGMFKTDDYSGELDFSKVENADKFKNSNMRLLTSYDDGESVTSVSGSYEKRRRGNSQWEDNSGIRLFAANDDNDPVIAERTMRNAIDTITPKLLPLNGDKALFLRLQDNNDRGVNDCSALVYSTVDWEGNESEPRYVEGDGTFDSNVAAAKIGGGRILVVWSDLTTVYGDEEVNLGEALNQTELSYCIFDADGTPGEVEKLTNQQGCEAMPTIAYDEATGKAVIAYTSTDYQTDGIAIGEDNMEELGNFLYNSYSTVCFKVLDTNGEIITDYTPAESVYQSYEAANGPGVLDGMRFMGVQLAADYSQATIDEMTAAAIGGKVYVFYSLDTDKDTATDEDRELFCVRCDLETMEQSAPVRLTNNLTADTNPQAVVYGDELQLYWNNNGIITCANPLAIQEEAGENISLSDFGEIIETMDGAAQTFIVTVQPGGNLCLLWNSWDQEHEEHEETDGARAALYYKEYDPDYKTETGDEENPYTYGKWGNVQMIDSAEANQDLNEIAYLDVGDVSIAAYKITNKAEDGTVESYDLYFSAFEERSSIDVDMAILPDYPMPNEKVILNISGTNTGSLPAEKVTMKAELVDKNGAATEIGTKVSDEHFQTSGSVAAAFEDFVIPANPSEYKVRVSAYEDELAEYPIVEEFPLPSGTDIALSDVELEQRGENQYSVSLNIQNKGNLNLDGGKVGLDYVDDDWSDMNAEHTFTPVSEAIPLTIAAKGETRESDSFDVSNDRFNEKGDCQIQLSIQDKDGKILASETLYLHSPKANEAAANDIYVNGTAQPDAISVKKGDTASFDVSIMPITARNGYHLAYSIDDPTVAEIDASGVVTGLKKGSAKLNIYAYKNENTMFIGSNSRAAKMDGTSIEIDENGMITNLTAASEQEPVLTKTVDITVTGSSSSGGGGGSSSGRQSLTVTFDSQGGSAVSSVKVLQNNTVSKPTDPARSGYTFGGWYTDKECTSVYYFDTKVTKNITLYAKWIKDETQPEWKNPFVDVQESDWFYDNVRYAYENKLFSGVSDTLFAPNEPMTRAMLVTVLYRAEGSPDMEHEIWGYPFADVDSESWYGAPVYWARMNDIINGYSDEEFAPDQEISREQIAAILERYAKYKNITTEEIGNLSQFTDTNQISDWAKENVAWAVGAGLISGKGNGILNPLGSATRAEVAAMLQRF